MRAGFRQSMAWLHTWTGLLVGWVLFFVFVTGTAGYFYVEIDRWMRPELPLAAAWPTPQRSAALADEYLRQTAPGADYWWVELPTGRQSRALRVTWGTGAGVYGDAEQHRVFDQARGAFTAEPPVRATDGAYGLYRMHWKLHYLPQVAGVWVVGICTMILLIALCTGVITHRKIFADFFTLRYARGQRSWLDAHNLLGVTTLPFLLMMTFSGLVFYMELYIPAGLNSAYPSRGAYFDELDLSYPSRRAGAAAPLLPLDRFVTAAPRYWRDAGPDRIAVQHPGDANAQVILLHDGRGTVLRDVTEELRFNGATGALVEQVSAQASTPRALRSVLFGLHEGIFSNLSLRWMYFLSGLLGCGMIATGLVLWTAKRRERLSSGPGSFGFRLIECLNIGSIAGLPIGVAAYFWANRLLPSEFAGRQAWEFHSLFIAWGAMVLYPAFRAPARAWADELWLAAAAFAALPAVNAVTTSRHLGVTIPAGDWELAAFDLTVLALGGLFAGAAILAGRRRAPRSPAQRDAQRPALASRYRWAVASRILAATAGSYGFTSVATAAGALVMRSVLSMSGVDAVLSATLLGLILYAVTVMAVFRAQSATRAWLGLAVATAPPLALLQMLT